MNIANMQLIFLLKNGSLDNAIREFSVSHHGSLAIIQCCTNMVSLRVIFWGAFSFVLV